MDKLWSLKFAPMMNVPGNQVTAWFDNEQAAREILERHAKLVSREPAKETEALVFDDLQGRHSMRVDFFPYCAMMEVGPAELMYKEINEKIRAAHEAAGTNKEVGFKGEVAGSVGRETPRKEIA